jgi:hypothetical protein
METGVRFDEVNFRATIETLFRINPIALIELNTVEEAMEYFRTMAKDYIARQDSFACGTMGLLITRGRSHDGVIDCMVSFEHYTVDAYIDRLRSTINDVLSDLNGEVS